MTEQKLDFFFYGMTVLSFLMSFAIGSNETDALASVYSSGAMNPFACVISTKKMSQYSFHWAPCLSS